MMAPTRPFMYHKLPENTIPSEAILTSEEAKKYLFDMFVIRQMETECSRMYKEKTIRGFCHLYSGQEACCVGMHAGLRPDDSVITSYRGHGWTYVKGQTVATIMSELTGRITGCSAGKGGSMHTYAPNFYGGNGIVGAQVPLGAGIAFAHKFHGDGKVCAILYGDGAANQGQVFETFNMAALWKVPAIFVCENNLYGMGTAIERSSASIDFYARGDFIPGIKVDGACIMSIREATKFAADYVRSGKGPIVMELLTYRYFGHSMSDPGVSYRPSSEVKNVKQTNDPIKILIKHALDGNLITEEEVQKLNEKATEIAEESAEIAMNAQFPPDSEIATDIYVGEQPTIRGCDPFTIYPAVEK